MENLPVENETMPFDIAAAITVHRQYALAISCRFLPIKLACLHVHQDESGDAFHIEGRADESLQPKPKISFESKVQVTVWKHLTHDREP